jgi:coenzyme F420-reducing hydrogenase alpha subunit
MTIAGRLEINLTCGPGPSASVQIASSRPRAIARMFQGRSPSEVAGLVPLLFSVCAMAQGATSATACERALGIATSPQSRQIRDLLVLAETAREHLLRVVIDWPRGTATESDPATLRWVMGLDQQFRRSMAGNGAAFAPGAAVTCDTAAIKTAIAELGDLLQSAVFAESPRNWLARCTVADLADWADAGTTPAQLLLRQTLRTVDAVPEMDNAEFAERLFGDDAERFVAKPMWQARPRETTALSRQLAHPLIQALGDERGHGVGARLAARLVELAGLPDRMTDLIEQDSAGCDADDAGNARNAGLGIARTEAARGRLIHGVEIRDGVVGRYLILAPTEWNFHPQGAAAQALAVIAGSGRTDARDLADLMITAFDPCVEYSLAVH